MELIRLNSSYMVLTLYLFTSILVVHASVDEKKDEGELYMKLRRQTYENSLRDMQTARSPRPFGTREVGLTG